MKRSKVMDGIDKALGGIVGLVCAALLILFLLAICDWIPSEGLHTFIGQSYVVGPLYNWGWFQNAITFIH